MTDYFPSSKSSSTSVKFAACLTEAVALWGASGGAILTAEPGSSYLVLAAERGVDLDRDLRIQTTGGALTARCFSRGKDEVVADLSSEESYLLPGIEAASAACVSVKAGSSVHGLLLLWSHEKSHFSEGDLVPLALFSNYVSLLLEIDELGEKLGENLIIDPLTGLHNRRQFEHRLHLEVTRAKRYTLHVSLVIFDVDHLDDYNESCGHMLGNLALSDIASIFKKGTREVDFVARIGGDEFAVLLPETNRLGALRLADRLRQNVAAYPFPVQEESSSASLTVTAGISSLPGSADNEQELLTRAYAALELAKAEGTNVIMLWDEPRT